MFCKNNKDIKDKKKGYSQAGEKMFLSTIKGLYK